MRRSFVRLSFMPITRLPLLARTSRPPPRGRQSAPQEWPCGAPPGLGGTRTMRGDSLRACGRCRAPRCPPSVGHLLDVTDSHTPHCGGLRHQLQGRSGASSVVITADAALKSTEHHVGLVVRDPLPAGATPDLGPAHSHAAPSFSSRAKYS